MRPVTEPHRLAARATDQWRGVIAEYRDWLPVTDATPVVSLREGGTPLLPAPVLSARTGCEVYLKVEGAKVTGTAKSQNGESKIQDGAIKGDEITFVENLDFQGQTLKIVYTGKIAGDEIKFNRKVGEFASEDFVAKRSK